MVVCWVGFQCIVLGVWSFACGLLGSQGFVCLIQCVAERADMASVLCMRNKPRPKSPKQQNLKYWITLKTLKP